MTKYFRLLFCIAFAVGVRAQSPIGLFEDHADVGTVLHPGSVAYDPAARTYTVAGSGENMWFATDAFQFVWKKVSGDVTLTADISFIGAGVEGHRKAVLMIRQNLDADSPYADVARHGEGLTSLQARDEKGANTSEIQSNTKSPRRVRIAKRGDYFYLWVAGPGEDVHFSGGSLRVAMHDPFYVGIGVCSHNKDVVEKAVFSNVELTTGKPAGQPKLYSTLEVVPLSGDRRAIYVTPGRITSPAWTSDGTAITVEREGHLLRVPAAGGEAQLLDTPAPAQKGVMFSIAALPDDGYRNFNPQGAPDGQIAFLSCEKEIAGPVDDKDMMLRVISRTDGKPHVVAKFIGGPGTLGQSSWSPDSRRLAFISYQWIQ